jgi:hypothetical protein
MNLSEVTYPKDTKNRVRNLLVEEARRKPKAVRSRARLWLRAGALAGAGLLAGTTVLVTASAPAPPDRFLDASRIIPSLSEPQKDTDKVRSPRNKCATPLLPRCPFNQLPTPKGTHSCPVSDSFVEVLNQTDGHSIFQGQNPRACHWTPEGRKPEAPPRTPLVPRRWLLFSS